MKSLIPKYAVSLEKTKKWLKPEKGNIERQLTELSVYSGIPIYVVFANYLEQYPEIEKTYKNLLKFYKLEDK